LGKRVGDHRIKNWNFSRLSKYRENDWYSPTYSLFTIINCLCRKKQMFFFDFFPRSNLHFKFISNKQKQKQELDRATKEVYDYFCFFAKKSNNWLIVYAESLLQMTVHHRRQKLFFTVTVNLKFTTEKFLEPLL
jgi:hypothetical protein